MARRVVGRRTRETQYPVPVDVSRRGADDRQVGPGPVTEELVHKARRPHRHLDLLSVLRGDHEDIQSQYEGFQTAGGDDRYFLANRIIRQLELHNRIEEEVFYPAVKAVAERQGHRKAAAAVRAALREHRSVQAQLARVKDNRAYDDRLTAQVDALMERVRRHVDTEERELFPVASALLGEARLLRLRQDARERQEELEHQLAA